MQRGLEASEGHAAGGRTGAVAYIGRRLLLLGALLAVALQGTAARAAGRMKVVTTCTVIADMARNVAGDAAVVGPITKPCAEIHNYQPTPGDILKARDADLILWNGLNLELWFEKFFRNLRHAPPIHQNGRIWVQGQPRLQDTRLPDGHRRNLLRPRMVLHRQPRLRDRHWPNGRHQNPHHLAAIHLHPKVSSLLFGQDVSDQPIPNHYYPQHSKPYHKFGTTNMECENRDPCHR